MNISSDIFMKQYALRHFSQRFDYFPSIQISEYINICRVYHLSR